MRVAIDARALSHPQRGGFKTYVEGLLPVLVASSPHRFTWYTDRLLAEEGRAPNLTIIAVPGSFPVIGMPFREQARLPQRLRMDKPDLAHFPCNTAPILCPVPNVITVHDLFQLDAWKRCSSGTQSLWQRSIAFYSAVALRRAIHRASMVITVSAAVRRQIVKHLHLAEDRVAVTYQAARPIFTADGPISPLPAGLRPGFILGIGSADPRKNMPGLLRSYRLLPGRLRKRVPLVIVCTHPSVGPMVSSHATRLGISPILLTSVDDELLARLYRAAGVFAFPSLAEGFGLPPLEAMASGTPVVVTDSTSLPEVIADAGLLVCRSDEAAFAGALQSVLEDRNLHDQLARRGRERASTFTWARCAKETIAVYEQAISRQGNL